MYLTLNHATTALRTALLDKSKKQKNVSLFNVGS